MTSLADRYRVLVSERGFESDPAQAKLVGRLDALAAKLNGYKAEGKPSGFSRLFGMKPPEPPRGLYIHGAVGRGKTMLMDMFFDAAPAPLKRRAHFHAFMADVHARLHQWRQAMKRGEATGEDPIAPVATELAREASLLCFDEFSVRDIADAMILRAIVHGSVHGRRGGGCDLERRAGRTLQGRPQPRAVPAVRRASERAARRGRTRRARRLPAREAQARAGLLYAARPEGGRRARRGFSGADRP